MDTENLLNRTSTLGNAAQSSNPISDNTGLDTSQNFLSQEIADFIAEYARNIYEMLLERKASADICAHVLCKEAVSRADCDMFSAVVAVLVQEVIKLLEEDAKHFPGESPSMNMGPHDTSSMITILKDGLFDNAFAPFITTTTSKPRNKIFLMMLCNYKVIGGEYFRNAFQDSSLLATWLKDPVDELEVEADFTNRNMDPGEISDFLEDLVSSLDSKASSKQRLGGHEAQSSFS
ncbi:hypothetical protein DFP72DRAFT_1073331 [Ephemerocybe angulata]|uniref:Uncharacterized protein n=1 Tax=Ephemerocybe angulata TaxID=980116 RepID=A0A8H6HMK8_9AGAR|nr:hypothetical protein DFP72DRAFT_1073331 [Tulosesus angulatus]